MKLKRINMPMRLAIDARILTHPANGIAVCLSNLLKEFYKNPQLEIFLFSDNPIHQEYAQIAGKARETVIFGRNYRKFWAQFFLPQQLKKYKIDLYYANWNNAVPAFRPCPCVLVIHDLLPWALSKAYFKKIKKEYKYKLQELICARLANRIITDSEYSRQDIIKYLGIKEGKIKVIYPGVDTDFLQAAVRYDAQTLLKKYNINSEFIIAVGGFDQPRRNCAVLIKAFYNLVNAFGTDLSLAIVGSINKEDKGYNECLSLIQELISRKKLIFIEHIESSHDMAKLIKSAKMLALPSLYEGFGLPLVEAMACGVPVISSNTSSMPEVVSGAGIMTAPDDVNGFMNSIKAISADEPLRRNLIEKGLQRAKMFSWEKTAKETLEVFERFTNVFYK